MKIKFRIIKRRMPLFYLILGILLLFQINLQLMIGPFQYFDEAVAALCICIVLGKAIRRQMERKELLCLICIFLAAAEGLICTVLSGVQTGLMPIVMDIGNTFKTFFVFLGILNCGLTEQDISDIFANLAVLVRGIVYIAGLCALVNLFADIGMSYDTRFGIPSFMFIYTHAALLNIMCYSFVVIQTVDLQRNRQNLFSLFVTTLIWISTLRARAVFYAAVYWVLYWVVVHHKGRKISKATKLMAAVVVAAAAVVFLREQFIYYFANANITHRYRLVMYGIRTFLNYFPLGSGFASYGSFAAAKYYSKLYYQYGFNQIWGLSPEYGYFLTDNYWPSVFAQFGLIGSIIIVCLLANLALIAVRGTKNQPYERLAALIGIICIYCASIATDSFSHYTTVGVFFFVALAVQKARLAEKRASAEPVDQRDDRRELQSGR